MSKKKRTEVIVVCMMAISIIVGITAFPLACQPTEPLVTGDCTDQTTNSLTAHATVNSLEAGTLLRRGFVFAEGTTGDPAFNITPLVNPSFEEGDPPDGWQYIGGTGERSPEKAKVGSYAIRFTIDENQWGSVMQTDPMPPEEMSEKTLTLGAWIWSDAPDRVRLYSTYWVGDSRTDRASAFHPGDGTWHWLTLTVSFPSGVTAWNLRAINVSPGPVITVYADGVVLVKNAILEDGTFATGEYSLVITGLKPNTSYRVRSFVSNTAGLSYGNTVTCKTAP